MRGAEYQEVASLKFLRICTALQEILWMRTQTLVQLMQSQWLDMDMDFQLVACMLVILGGTSKLSLWKDMVS